MAPRRADPSDRLAAVREMARSVGGDVESISFMFGAKDGFVILDAPDATSAAAVSIAVSSTGAVHGLETHQLIAPADLGGVLERAAAAHGAYGAPGT